MDMAEEIDLVHIYDMLDIAADAPGITDEAIASAMNFRRAIRARMQDGEKTTVSVKRLSTFRW